MTRVLTVLGTRPEAVKLAPLIKALKLEPWVESCVCTTGQHRSMLDQVLQLFEIAPDHDINIMRPGQTLSHITSGTLEGVDRVIGEFKPDWIVVQGDTTTTLGAALSAFYGKVPVLHVEAGLRTGNVMSPWPEEMNRKLVSQIASLHCCPTEQAANNLRAETHPESSILVTGNTVIDALHWVSSRIEEPRWDEMLRQTFHFLDPARRIVLATGHRRENFDGGLERVCHALAELADRRDVQVVYPVHLNPRVQDVVSRVLMGRPRVHLIEPVEYAGFVYLMKQAYLIISDSGGIQEEAPALGKPVLVTRDTTERPEAIEAGTAKLVGTDRDEIVRQATLLLDDPTHYDAMAQAANPFGDGQASRRIVEKLKSFKRPF